MRHGVDRCRTPPGARGRAWEAAGACGASCRARGRLASSLHPARLGVAAPAPTRSARGPGDRLLARAAPWGAALRALRLLRADRMELVQLRGGEWHVVAAGRPPPAVPAALSGD